MTYKSLDFFNKTYINMKQKLNWPYFCNFLARFGHFLFQS